MTILFIGDIHQQWDKIARGLDALADPPGAAVLLGDIECDQPLDELAAPLLDRGIAVHWIFGNHDNDGGPEMWANLCDPSRNPRTAAGALHGRVVEIAGLRVAGLGGTFRPRVWDPPSAPRLHGRAHLHDDVAALGAEWRDTHREALMHSLSSAAIWPEDYHGLAEQRADILVTHEAPSSLRRGKDALDALARAMGAGLIVHGHHHVGYRAVAADGLRVMGVASAWGTSLDGAVLWTGDTQRHHAAAPDGWVVEA
jgi:predicted phosphodiesterase